MKTKFHNLVVSASVVLVLTTTVSPSVAQDYTGAVDCCSMAGTVISGACIRPAFPATISVGIILVEFTDRAHFTRLPDLPSGYLKQHFEEMLFSDNFYISPPNLVQTMKMSTAASKTGIKKTLTVSFKSLGKSSTQRMRMACCNGLTWE